MCYHFICTKMLLTYEVFLLLAIAAKGVFSYVTHLPKCKYNGNFSKWHEGKYFKGTIAKTIKNVTREKCTLHCVLHKGCLSFNQKKDGAMCELITSHLGTYEEKPGWQVVSTDYTSYDYRGPMCRYLKPKCDFTIEYCIDVCEAPGYKCEKNVNLAKNKAVKSSSVASNNKNYKTKHAVDGEIGTKWISDDKDNQWISVDLAAVYKIPFVTLVNRNDKAKWDRLKDFTIRIGEHDESQKDQNQVCAKNQDQSKLLWQRYICENGPIDGRYVSLTRSSKQYFSVGEINVYAL